MTDPKQPTKLGRPALPPGEAKTARIELRLTPAHKAAFRELGGVAWFERKIEEERKRLAAQASRR